MATGTNERRGQLARVDALFERLAELQGQRNAIDAEIVDVVRDLAEEDLWGITGARSLEHCVAWKTGSSRSHAEALSAVARRAEELPRCVAGLRSGVLSLDQVGVIAERAVSGPGVDEHYATLAESATVAQLRTALRIAPRPEPDRRPEPERSVMKLTDEDFTYWRIKMPHVDAAVFDAALQSHLDALVAEYRRDREAGGSKEAAPPFPTVADAFVRLVEHGWDADVAARPHGQRTTVVVHVDVEARVASLHLGPALTEAERRFLCCDALVETWFERDGEPIGVGRTTRAIPRRIRRVLERRHPTCAVEGCGATRGLHAHHLWHWEDGGPTELWNLVLVCPFHHRLHHRGVITISGPAPAVTVTDVAGRTLDGSSLARPPTGPPPPAPPYRGPIGERADWKWYAPFAPRGAGADN
jgi:hypothetical protein